MAANWLESRMCRLVDNLPESSVECHGDADALRRTLLDLEAKACA